MTDYGTISEFKTDKILIPSITQPFSFYIFIINKKKTSVIMTELNNIHILSSLIL